MINIIPKDYFEIKKNGITPFQTMIAYLGGSMFQTVVDNPITAYRQLIQQYAKDMNGKNVEPKIATMEVNKVFKNHPLSASMSGLYPRLVGVGFKRVPKFGFFLGYSFIMGEEGTPGLMAATFASIFSAPFINPIRMIEKQQRAFYKTTGKEKSIKEILKESAEQKYKPLFRGTLPLMGHSLASATTGLVGQPELQKYIQKKLNSNGNLGTFTTGLISSAIVSPIYIIMTNPLSRLEVIMQTSSIKNKPIGLIEAVKEVVSDSRQFGLKGIFRGQGVGVAKAIVSLTMFHQGRIFLIDYFKNRNEKLGLKYKE